MLLNLIVIYLIIFCKGCLSVIAWRGITNWRALIDLQNNFNDKKVEDTSDGKVIKFDESFNCCDGQFIPIYPKIKQSTTFEPDNFKSTESSVSEKDVQEEITESIELVDKSSEIDNMQVTIDTIDLNRKLEITTKRGETSSSNYTGKCINLAINCGENKSTTNSSVELPEMTTISTLITTEAINQDITTLLGENATTNYNKNLLEKKDLKKIQATTSSLTAIYGQTESTNSSATSSLSSPSSSSSSEELNQLSTETVKVTFSPSTTTIITGQVTAKQEEGAGDEDDGDSDYEGGGEGGGPATEGGGGTGNGGQPDAPEGGGEGGGGGEDGGPGPDGGGNGGDGGEPNTPEGGRPGPEEGGGGGDGSGGEPNGPENGGEGDGGGDPNGPENEGGEEGNGPDSGGGGNGGDPDGSDGEGSGGGGVDGGEGSGGEEGNDNGGGGEGTGLPSERPELSTDSRPIDGGVTNEPSFTTASSTISGEDFSTSRSANCTYFNSITEWRNDLWLRAAKLRTILVRIYLTGFHSRQQSRNINLSINYLNNISRSLSKQRSLWFVNNQAELAKFINCENNFNIFGQRVAGLLWQPRYCCINGLVIQCGTI